MTTGAVFKLIANDGKADRMIMATKLLFQRIQEVIYQRTKQGKADITPTLADLERTHILYINAHFKPFAAIGYEYQKVKPQSGTSTLGGSVTFSIPQFGDFFHDMVCRVRLGQVYAAAGNTPASAANTIFPLNSSAAAGGVLYNIVDYAGNVIVAGSTSAVASKPYRNYVRYCEFPGNKLFTKVKFEVNGNPLDEYDQYVPVMLEKFTVMPHKRNGYNTLIGQQNELRGVSGLQNCSVYDTDTSVSGGSSLKQLDVVSGTTTTLIQTAAAFQGKQNTPTGITKFGSTQSNQTVAFYQSSVTATPVASVDRSVLANPSLVSWNAAAAVAPVPTGVALNGAVSAGTITAFAYTDSSTVAAGYATASANQAYDLSQRAVTVLNGPQTAKPIQPPLEIWNKLKFWFNDDVRLSIPSVSIPFGMRFITIDLAPASALVYEEASIFLETIVYSNVISGALAPAAGNVAGTTIVATVGGTGGTAVANGVVTESRTYTKIFTRNGLAADPAVEQIELYINNIFVSPEVHDIFIRRIGFALIRVYRQQKSTLTASGTQELLLSALKWPVEYMFVGLQPVFNVKEATTAAGLVTGGNVNTWRDWHRMTRQIEATSPDTVVASTAVTYSSRGAVDPTKYWLPVPTVDSLSLVTHGINIFDNFSDLFFSAYSPYHYGQSTITTPTDVGAYFVNMSLFPRAYQPGGHLNISRVRETYLKFVSSYCGSTTNCAAIIVAVCINFLITSDGSAMLRYST